MQRKKGSPQFVNYFGPLLKALNELGGSGRPQEVYERVAVLEAVTEEKLKEINRNGSSKYENQVAWARFYLVKAGLLDSSKHGVWALTEKGRNAIPLSIESSLALMKTVQAESRHRNEGEEIVREPDIAEESAPEVDGVSRTYRQELLAVLRSVSAGGFERLCKRLLREAGFENVEVTGRSGDGGIDGHGMLQINDFVSIKVIFQCKRYVGSVGSREVRDFRGAMTGRADKGIILTTGSFTADAQRESIRDGAPLIELVNGERLLDMFEKYELGLKPVTVYDIDEKFFDEFRRD